MTPCHCWGTSTTICPDSSTTVQWTSESGTAELSVHLSPAADSSDISVPELTPIQMGFTPPTQPRPHLLSGTPFTDLSATYSELTGQPTPSYTTFVTTSGMSVSETVFPPVLGAGTTETVPLSVASIDPPTLGVFQAQATVTAPIVATTLSVPTPALQTRFTATSIYRGSASQFRV
jgi:hypothetical protein